MSNNDCGFAGNSDIYGLGIRIGYYTQALAVWFSNFFFLSEARDLRAVNGLFLLALAIIILVYTHDTTHSYAIEAFLLMQIGLCLGSISIMDSTRYSSKYLAASKERLVLRTVLLNIGLAYNLYFWWFGLNSYEATPCGTFVFYFVRTNLYGRLRTVMKVFAVAGLVWRTLFTTIYDAGKILRRYHFKEGRRRFIENTLNEDHPRSLPPNDLILSLSSKAVQASIPLRAIDPSTPGGAVSLNAAVCSGKGKEQGAGVIQQIPIPQPSNDKGKVSGNSPIASVLSTKFPSTNPVHSIEPRNSGYLSFQKVYEAENYLSQMLSPQGTKFLEKERPSQPSSGSVRCTKTTDTKKPRTGVSFITQLQNQMKIVWADTNTRYIRDTFSVHFKATDSHIHRWPMVISRLLDSKAESPPPHWQAVAIASDIQLSQLPLVIPRKVWLFNLIQSFCIIAILVVQIELTIVWNQIQSIQALRSVGQLFPLILGVGGLAKVFWGKWKMLKEGVKEDEEFKGRRLSEYELGMEKYLEWRKRQEERPKIEGTVNVNTDIAPLPA